MKMGTGTGGDSPHFLKRRNKRVERVANEFFSCQTAIVKMNNQSVTDSVPTYLIVIDQGPRYTFDHEHSEISRRVGPFDAGDRAGNMRGMR